jgi:hypothetical protein
MREAQQTRIPAAAALIFDFPPPSDEKDIFFNQVLA